MIGVVRLRATLTTMNQSGLSMAFRSGVLVLPPASWACGLAQISKFFLLVSVRG